jgi:crotonobetainyl-CoA:carnitine CoA-transferase CaiB-like acyl-CoA transferase
MTRAFEDLTVVELCGNQIGATVGQFFADYGAKVVMIEPPGGTPLRAQAAFPMWARGKQSVVLDAKDPEDHAAVVGLVKEADVLIETFRPGAAERLGLGYAALQAWNPRLVYLSVTGFGDEGPYSAVKAYEAVVQAKVGLLKMSEGMKARPGPAFVSAPYCTTTVTQVAVHGVLAALIERLKSGEGQRVQANMALAIGAHDTWNAMVAHVAKQYPDAFQSVPPVDDEGIPVHGVLFRLMTSVSADGRWLQFSQTAQRLFEAFMHEVGLDWMFGDPEWKTAPEFEESWKRKEFWERLIEQIQSKTVAQWNEIFDANPDVWAEVFRHGPEVMQHPQLVHDRRVLEITDPDRGPVRQLARLVALSGEPAMEPRPAPRCDEHAGDLRRSGGPVAGRHAQDRPAAPWDTPPLDGLLVLELGTQYAAPFGATILAELGARVIKIEQQDGDQVRWMTSFPEVSGVKVLQGKECLAVDIRHPEGLALVHELVKKADVVLQSFRAGVAKRRKLDEETLRALNPDLIYISAPAYGEDGPCGHRPAYAPTIGAACGLPWRNLGTTVPEGPGLDLETVKASSMRLRAATMGGAHADGFSALGVGTALLLGIYVRERGLGARHVVTSMILTTAHAVADGIVDWPGRPETPVADDELLGFNALYRLYPASAGWVVLAAPADSEWAAVAAALADHSSVGTDPRFRTAADRRANDDALAKEIAAVLRTRTAEEWEEYFLPLDVACVSVTDKPTYECLYGDELGRASGYVVDVSHPLFGDHPRSAPLVRFSRSATRAGAGCLLGEHTDSILAELGRSSEEINRLRDAGVVS